MAGASAGVSARAPVAPAWGFPWWLIVAGLGVAFLLFAAVLYLRRIALGGSARPAEGLTIEQIRKLHRDGLLSDEEYDRARRAAARQPRPGTRENPGSGG